MKWIKEIKQTIISTYLCIRYPYLYPRNVWTDRHYNNWKIQDYLHGPVNNRENHGLFGKAYKYDKNAGTTRFGDYVVKSIPYWIWYHIVKFIYDWIIPIFHCIPTYNLWEQIPKGWKIAFGNDLLKELDQAIHKEGGWKLARQIRIMQIKEKFGTLRIYVNYAPQSVYDVIDKYEDISYHTCIDCGKPATKITRGWILPMCDECYNKYENR